MSIRRTRAATKKRPPGGGRNGWHYQPSVNFASLTFSAGSNCHAIAQNNASRAKIDQTFNFFHITHRGLNLGLEAILLYIIFLSCPSSATRRNAPRAGQMATGWQPAAASALLRRERNFPTAPSIQRRTGGGKDLSSLRNLCPTCVTSRCKKNEPTPTVQHPHENGSPARTRAGPRSPHDSLTELTSSGRSPCSTARGGAWRGRSPAPRSCGPAAGP